MIWFTKLLLINLKTIKFINIERIKSILPTEKLRENFDFYSYLDDKNKLKNLKFKIKSLKHQAVNIFQSEL